MFFSCDRELRDLKHRSQASREERDTLNAEQQQLLKEKSKLELTIKDLSDEVKGDNQSKERAERELQRLHETIAQKDGELERIKPQYEEMKRREEECTREFVLLFSRFSSLLN